MIAEIQNKGVRAFVTIIFAVLGASFARNAILAIRVGEILCGSGSTAYIATKKNSPVMFWFAVILSCGTALVFIIAIPFLLFLPLVGT